MMRVLPLVFLVAAATAAAQPARQAEAMTYYHDGARQFIDGDLATAGQTVDVGLAIAPDNPRLRALRELIRQQEQQDGGGGESPDEDGDEGGQPPEGGQGDDSGESDGADDPADPSQDGGTPDAPDDPTQGPSPQSDGSNAAGDPSQNGGAGGAAPDGRERPASRLDRAQAGAILDAVGGDERLLLRALPRRPTPGRQPERDW